MMDYNHRRTASEAVVCNNSAAAAARQPRNGWCPKPTAGFAFADMAMDPKETPGQQRFASHGFADDFYGPMTNKATVFYDSLNINSNNSHLRSQSCEATYSWGQCARNGASPAPATPTGHRYGYDSLVSSDAYPYPYSQNAFLAPSATFRRGSESSTSSTISSGTATGESASGWSAATTPEAMSPTSPSNSITVISPPERISSKIGFIVTEPPSPSRIYQSSISSRPSRGRACSQSTFKYFQNTPIESPVPEEEEQGESYYNSKKHKSRPSQDASLIVDVAAENNGSPNLHERRQQRQQKIAGKPLVKAPVRLRLTPLPTLPADRRQSVKTPSSMSPRTLKPSRSMPQIRDQCGPPPAGPLPPLPAVPKLSPFNICSIGSSMPPSPLSTGFSIPPHPSMPPPPPPTLSRSPTLSSSSSVRTLTASATLATITDNGNREVDAHLQQNGTASWENELQRHKKLLEQFPQPGDNTEKPKLTRTHRSLGNLRARSRSLSRAVATSQDDSAATDSWMAIHPLPFNLCETQAQRPSTAGPFRDLENRIGDPLPSFPTEISPHISVFEDDSDDEGDKARKFKFVKNLFSRRVRSAEVASSKGLGPDTREAKTWEGYGHNDRKKNFSTSSTASMATTVGASTVFSTTTTIAATSTDGSYDCCEADCSGEPSPRTSADSSHAPQKEKAPLFSRMFVRRSR